MTPRPEHLIRPVAGLVITRELPLLVQIDDDLLSGAPRNQMNITVWVGESDSAELRSTIARALTISFLERTLERMRAMPSESFEATVPHRTRSRTRDVRAG